MITDNELEVIREVADMVSPPTINAAAMRAMFEKGGGDYEATLALIMKHCPEFTREVAIEMLPHIMKPLLVGIGVAGIEAIRRRGWRS